MPSKSGHMSPGLLFGGGLDAGRFNHHYAEAQRDKRLLTKQRIYTAWHFYFGPLAIGMGFGGLVADRFFPADADLLPGLLVAYGLALIITPTLLVYLRRKHGHRRYQQFYNAALERCIEEEQVRT